MRMITLMILIIIFSFVNNPQKISQEKDFIALISSQGASKALEYYRNFKKNNPDAVLFKRETINNLGWQTAEKGDIDEAIKLFELNILAYPDHYDPWDSYAEAILIRGGENYKDLAVKNFEKSLELNPDNNNAIQRLTVIKNYTEQEYMIPMRDGVKLFTQVYVPNDNSRQYPIMFQREWYSVGSYGLEYRRRLHPNELFVREGFIFVFQDIRGRFMSEGEFKVLRPFNKNKTSDKDIDESTDAFDTIEWLVKNLKGYNGKVGIRGGSYSGWAALMAAIEPHPSVKAISVAASPADWWMGDDLHHNGAFRLMYAYSWVGRDAWPQKNGPTSKQVSWPGYTTSDGYKFFLDLGPIKNVNNKYFKNENPTWNEYMQHGDYDEFDIPEAYVFQTGTNQWEKYDSWPPENIKETNIYLDDKGTLTFEPDYNDDGIQYDEFLSDPNKPVPWSTSKQTQQGSLWMISDQRFASCRPDVLVYETRPLEEDITIAGPIIAHLNISTTGTDADWVIKLIDVYPSDSPGILGDYQMLLAGDVFRSKYRNSFETPEALIPNKITDIEFNLFDKFHTFKKGHKIMVQIQSTWFPVIDRNPQTFCNIYEAEEGDFQTAFHRVYHSKTAQSFISLKILTK